ncbi:unnamed protein product, partial [Effrenium voratum]
MAALARKLFSRARARHFCASEASEAMMRAAKGGSQASFRQLVAAVDAGGEGFWHLQAQEEERMQLEQLAQALPRGGRLAPGLLDHVLPAEPTATEEVLQNLPRMLGAREGVVSALRWRAALRSSALSADFAAQRLERRVARKLRAWLNEGFLRTMELSSEEARQLCTSQMTPAHARTFALCFMTEDGPLPLVALQATDADTETPLPTDAGAARIWALHFAAESPEGLRGLGLGRALLQRAVQRLRDAGAKDVVATVPLRHFRAWLQQRRLEVPPEAAALMQSSGQGQVIFRDAANDEVRFEASGSLKVAINGAEPAEVRRIKFTEDAVLVLLQEGAVQIGLPKEDSASLASRLKTLAAIGGLLDAELKPFVMQLGFAYLFQQPGRAVDPAVHFHLLNGADFLCLHWRADESPQGLAESFGMVASFRYQEDQEEQRAHAYREGGVDAVLR